MLRKVRGVVNVRGGCPELKEVRWCHYQCKGEGLVLMTMKFNCGTCLEVMVFNNPSME